MEDGSSVCVCVSMRGLWRMIFGRHERMICVCVMYTKMADYGMRLLFDMLEFKCRGR